MNLQSSDCRQQAAAAAAIDPAHHHQLLLCSQLGPGWLSTSYQMTFTHARHTHICAVALQPILQEEEEEEEVKLKKKRKKSLNWGSRRADRLAPPGWCRAAGVRLITPGRPLAAAGRQAGRGGEVFMERGGAINSAGSPSATLIDAAVDPRRPRMSRDPCRCSSLPPVFPNSSSISKHNW